MKCQDFREIIDSYLSDELLTETNHGVLRHLEECRNCRGEIEARREIRGRLKVAVLNSARYQIDEDFASNLESVLSRSPIKESEERSASWLARNTWIAAAAGLFLVFTLGFVLINQIGSDGSNLVVSTRLTSSLQQNDLVNIALGDHEHCAMRHELEDPTFSLQQASAKYKDLDKIVVPSIQKVLSKYEFVMAHGCKYKDTQFAHVVLKNQGKPLSVLVTDQDNFDETKSKDLLRFSSTNPQYQIARYDTKTHAVFVISDMDEKKNLEALEALSSPLRKHLGDQGQFQTAMLAFY